VQVLYILGARKIALSAVGPLGCVPHEVSIHGKPGSLCVEAENDAVTLLNDKLKALVQRFNQQFPDAKFVLIPGLSTDTTAKMAQGNYFFFLPPTIYVHIKLCCDHFRKFEK